VLTIFIPTCHPASSQAICNHHVSINTSELQEICKPQTFGTQRPYRMTSKTSALPQLILLCFLTCLAVSHARHVYTDSFPSSYEEYDSSLLDPDSAYGSPYGGYSRATQSRLASLPLHLPPTTEELEDYQASNPTNTLYFKVRNSQGKLFACRVYHEDELEPDSLNESMFTAPRLLHESSYPAIASEAGAATNKASMVPQVPRAEDPKKDALELPSSSLPTDSKIKAIERIDALLDQLEGTCAQIHKGWWSYEWCYGNKITQFHIDMDQFTAEIRVESFTKLGQYETRNIVLNQESLEPNELAEDTPELARVTDTYADGDVCTDTGRPRTSQVHLMCCSPRILARQRGLLHRHKIPFDSDIVALVDVVESKEEICTYNVTLCTPLLCDGSRTKVKNSAGVTIVDGPPDTSVNGILKRALGMYCLQTLNAGWWTYELCHGQKVRQYHETVTTSKTKAGIPKMIKTVESEHILGLYKGTEIKSKDEEWKNVVNVTKKHTGTTGNGAYYEIEYTGGDVCDHADVTESAVVAGSHESDGVQRASSVRYMCGETMEIAVREDSTCHYIVEVRLPDLCDHPLFRAPVSKKQVVKCLPAR
jgi:Glucosidase II beta subunit-like protein